MNKKRLLALSLAVLIVGASSAYAYASQNFVDSTKNVVKTVAAKHVNTSPKTISSKEKVLSDDEDKTISDEQAITVATQAMKDYMGRDADFFSETKIIRYRDERKATLKKAKGWFKKLLKEKIARCPRYLNEGIVDVFFTPKSAEAKKGSIDFVSIYQPTGEIVNITTLNYLDGSYTAKFDNSKIKASILNFSDKIGNKIGSDYLYVRKKIDTGRVFVDCADESGRYVQFELNLKDYSVIHYEVDYEKETKYPDKYIILHPDKYIKLSVK